jgi:hypothetical protein
VISSSPTDRPASSAGRSARSWVSRLHRATGWWQFRARRAERAAYLADVAEVDDLAWAWRRAAEGAGIAREVSTVTGPTVSVPRLVDVKLGPPTVLLVELLPGQLPADVCEAAGRLAPHLGAARMRVQPYGLHHVRLVLLAADPLAATTPVPSPALAGPVLLARDEQGEEVRAEPAELPHLVVQGGTRSGKSTWLYGLLAQVAGRPDVLIAGVDPSGLLLRPFAGTRHAPWQACGLADPGRIVAVLVALVAEMDRRIAEMSSRADTVRTSPTLPLLLVVLEEYAGLLRALDAADKDAGKRARSAVARLLAESHKAGLRVVLVVQRAEAALIGGAERSNAAGRLSFGVDNAESVKLLHPDVDPLIAAQHTAADPGVALLTWPGHPLRRVRGPWIGGYAAFVDGVAGDPLSP